MPIYRLLQQEAAFEPPHVEAMAFAFEAICVERKLRALNDNDERERIARLVIEIAKRGERDPIRLRDQVLAALRA
jgi:hypothetical protein